MKKQGCKHYYNIYSNTLLLFNSTQMWRLTLKRRPVFRIQFLGLQFSRLMRSPYLSLIHIILQNAILKIIRPYAKGFSSKTCSTADYYHKHHRQASNNAKSSISITKWWANNKNKSTDQPNALPPQFLPLIIKCLTIQEILQCYNQSSIPGKTEKYIVEECLFRSLHWLESILHSKQMKPAYTNEIYILCNCDQTKQVISSWMI